jgi:hypothetical protein
MGGWMTFCSAAHALRLTTITARAETALNRRIIGNMVISRYLM